MSAPIPHGPRPAVLSGGHIGIALAALALLLAGPAFAQDPGDGRAKEPERVKGEGKGNPKDGKKDEGKDEKKDGAKEDKGTDEPKKKSEEEKLLESLGAAWKAGDAKGIAARFPAKRKVSLRIPGAEAGDYRAEQARSLLDAYFAARTFTKVVLQSVKETTGTFAVEYVRTADRRTVRAEVVLALGTEEKTRVLVSIRESP